MDYPAIDAKQHHVEAFSTTYDGPLIYSTVTSKHDKYPIQRQTTWSAFCQSLKHVERNQKDGPGIIFSVLDGLGRGKQNVLNVTAIVLDIEQQNNAPPPPPPEELLVYLNKINQAALIYTTFSHTLENPRYRVIFPLDKPILPSTLEVATREAMDRLHLGLYTDRASWSLARIMYFPACVRGANRTIVCHLEWRSYLPRFTPPQLIRLSQAHHPAYHLFQQHLATHTV